MDHSAGHDVTAQRASGARSHRCVVVYMHTSVLGTFKIGYECYSGKSPKVGFLARRPNYSTEKVARMFSAPHPLYGLREIVAVHERLGDDYRFTR
ncbi:hypothetical protein EVAR_43051_1 [Eumeta japonica]|uniref:Uncharacterized protein n=1 Tax=Eumeta variegata TaxID=151549 RepID=A0A4C1XPA2_EUMVA|nr:hypothetical protein EVAR_43051_1 [Eumeta japonica]